MPVLPLNANVYISVASTRLGTLSAEKHRKTWTDPTDFSSAPRLRHQTREAVVSSKKKGRKRHEVTSRAKPPWTCGVSLVAPGLHFRSRPRLFEAAFVPTLIRLQFQYISLLEVLYMRSCSERVIFKKRATSASPRSHSGLVTVLSRGKNT